MRDIAIGSVDSVFAKVTSAEHSEEIIRGSFESALDGIRSGLMTYKHDKLLPMIEAEMA